VWPGAKYSIVRSHCRTSINCNPLQMTDIKQNTSKLLEFVGNKFQSGEIDNNSLLQLIELAGNYLNLQTLPAWAEANKKSYNTAKVHRNKIELFGVKFIVDND